MAAETLRHGDGVWSKIFFRAQGGGFGPHEGQGMQQVKKIVLSVERCVMVAKRGRTDGVRRGRARDGKVDGGLIARADSVVVVLSKARTEFRTGFQ